MKEWNDMRQVWQQQKAEPVDPQTVKKIMSKRLERKIYLFQQEQSGRYYLFTALFALLIGSVYSWQAISKESYWTLLFAGGFFFMAGVHLWYGLKWRRISLPSPQDNSLAYLKAVFSQLKLHHQMRKIVIWGSLPLAAGLGLSLWEINSPEPMPVKVALAIIAFGLVALGLVMILLWWYRNHHPYRPNQLREEIAILLAEFEGDER